MSGLYPVWKITSGRARFSLVTSDDRSGAVAE